MKARPYKKKCLFCGDDFFGDKVRSKYCSPKCRYAFQAQNQSEKTKARRQEYQKKWGQENWQKRREYMLQFTYGLTGAQYQELLERQKYACAVCGRPETDFSKKLAVDHDHKTMEIFGLLCQQCNHVLIGKFRDPEMFQRAARYLQKGTGWFVPPKKKKRKKRT